MLSLSSPASMSITSPRLWKLQATVSHCWKKWLVFAEKSSVLWTWHWMQRWRQWKIANWATHCISIIVIVDSGPLLTLVFYHLIIHWLHERHENESVIESSIIQLNYFVHYIALSFCIIIHHHPAVGSPLQVQRFDPDETRFQNWYCETTWWWKDSWTSGSGKCNTSNHCRLCWSNARGSLDVSYFLHLIWNIFKYIYVGLWTGVTRDTGSRGLVIGDRCACVVCVGAQCGCMCLMGRRSAVGGGPSRFGLFWWQGQAS